MSNPSKQKGSRVEREIVDLHKEIGVHAERIPLSGASGGSFSGDVIISNLRGEVKCRANGTGFATLERWLGKNDILFLRRDRQKPFVVVPWQTWKKLIKIYAWEECTMLSKCCKSGLIVETADEGTSCYVCEECGKPCDILVENENGNL